MEKVDNEWTEYTPAPRGLQYIDTPYGSRIWRSSAGQIVLEPAPPKPEIIVEPLELEPQTLEDVIEKPKPKKKPRSKKK